MKKQPWQMTPEEEDAELVPHRKLKLVNLEQVYASSVGAKCINADTLMTKNLSEDITSAIFSNCDGDLGFVPTCQCGMTRGVSKAGLICPYCDTECSSQFVDSLEHSSWINIPEEFPPVLHPTWYMVLAEFAQLSSRKRGAEGGMGKYNVIDVFLNPKLESGNSGIVVAEELQMLLAGKRGFSYFAKHPDEMLDIFMYGYKKNAKNKKLPELEAFRRQYQDVLFTRKLPLLHSSLHPLTSGVGGTMKYMDKSSGSIIEAIVDLNNALFKIRSSESKGKPMSDALKDKKLFSIYTKIIDYYDKLINTSNGSKIASKQGILRKHCFGSRLHDTYRAVVIPQVTPMPLDELVMPWGIMVTVLKPNILNYLVNVRKMSVPDALDKYHQSLAVYDEVVDEAITSYIAATRKGKIPVIMGRNPTIAYGSLMLLYVKNYKKAPRDETISVNACIVNPLNMDFDGMVCCRH